MDAIGSLPAELAPDADGVWLYKDAEHQALLLRKSVRLRYLPIRRLQETEGGELRFSNAEWGPGLPLDMTEDAGAEWRSEGEWLRLTHDRAYSNAVVGLATFFAPFSGPATADPLIDFEWRERRSVAPDLLVLANNHWNFNVRSFNPGGNHGSFFPVSTHATLLFAGGEETGIPRGLKISEPYDALSFAPTVLKLTGRPEYAQPPGSVIEELFQNQRSSLPR